MLRLGADDRHMNDERLQSWIACAREQIAIDVVHASQTDGTTGIYDEQQANRAFRPIEVVTQLSRVVV
jgi:hypothetical protein